MTKKFSGDGGEQSLEKGKGARGGENKPNKTGNKMCVWCVVGDPLNLLPAWTA